jgi:shikimate kinase
MNPSNASTTTSLISRPIVLPAFLCSCPGSLGLFSWALRQNAATLRQNIYGIRGKFTPFREESWSPGDHSQGWGDQKTVGDGVRLKKTVVMVGMMGAGKTAVGTALARLLGVPFRDSDEEIVKAADRSIAEIFERDGEAFFRSRETEVIARLLKDDPAVLSTGGGAFLSAGNREMISEQGVSVWLRVELDLLWNRVRHKTTRPLLRTANPRETLRTLYEARLPFYQMADLTVDSACDLSVEDMARRVIEALGTRADVLERD